jgi:glycosyltransferase involved in cell wall biosynthesis
VTDATVATVVIPTHNRLNLLAATIGSVLQQVGVSLEVVVVDDGSTDGTGPWLDQIAAEDRRIKVVHHQQPQFMSAARNAGIARASARWVAFCDDDDLWAPDKLVAQLRALDSAAARWACTGVIVVNERLEIVGHHHAKGGDVLSGLLEENLIPSGSSVIADLRLVEQLGGFDPSLHGSEDWDFWIRLAQHSPLAPVDRPLIAYRLGTASMSMDIDRMRAGRATIAERYAGLASERGVLSNEVRHERYLAKQLLRAGSRRRAASIFASLAVKHKRWRELPRVAAALLAPRWTDRLGMARWAATMPAGWQREAEAWLRPLRGRNQRRLLDHRAKRRSQRQQQRI